MFLTTIERAGKLPDTTTPLVVSGADQQVGIERELGAAGFGDAPLILEPIGRNTAPAVAVAALHLTAFGDDPLLLVLPADHVIENEAALAEAVVVAAGLAGGRPPCDVWDHSDPCRDRLRVHRTW